MQVLPNWYVAGEGPASIPRVIKSTSDESLKFVGKFDTMEKSIRGDEDIYRPLTPEQRFKRNRVTQMVTENNRILPTPLSVRPVVPKSTLVVTGDNWNIVYAPELRSEAFYLRGISSVIIVITFAMEVMYSLELVS